MSVTNSPFPQLHYRPKSTPYFGDAFFERRAKIKDKNELSSDDFYESTGRIPQSKEKIPAFLKQTRRTIRQLLNKIKNQKNDLEMEKALSLPNVTLKSDNAGKSGFLWNKDKTVSPLKKELQSSRINLNIQKIAQANAELAFDELPGAGDTAKKTGRTPNDAAFDKLKKAIDHLTMLGYFNRPEIEPVVLHGLANRGSYTFMNSVYRETESVLGKEDMKKEEETFEGMGLEFKNTNAYLNNFNRVMQELPFLEKAIKFSDKLKTSNPLERLSAKAEYLTLYGEIQHGLSHFKKGLLNQQDFNTHSHKARKAFHQAIEAYNEIPDSQKTSYQKEALRKLKEQKASHMCAENGLHTTNSGSAAAVCKTLFNYGVMRLRELSNGTTLVLNE